MSEDFRPAPIKPMISFDEIGRIDIGYADGVTPALAVPERKVPNGARAG